MRTTFDSAMAASSRTRAAPAKLSRSAGLRGWLLAQAGPGERRPDQPGLLGGQRRLFPAPGPPRARVHATWPAPRPVLIGEEPDRVGSEERAESWLSTHVVHVQVPPAGGHVQPAVLCRELRAA